MVVPDLSLPGNTVAAAAETAAASGAPSLNIEWDSQITPTWLNLIQFHGFNSHGAYWDEGDPPANGVVDEIVGAVFAGTAVLPAAAGPDPQAEEGKPGDVTDS